MKRDMKLCNKILLEIEKIEDPYHDFVVFDDDNFEEYTSVEIKTHVDLLDDAGFIVKKDYRNYPHCLRAFITWGGYDYIDDIKIKKPLEVRILE